MMCIVEPIVPRKPAPKPIQHGTVTAPIFYS